MTVFRRFLIASSIARLIRKERPGATITQGYLAVSPERTSYVHVDGDASHLVLVAAEPGGGRTEDRTSVPRLQSEVLLDVAIGRLVYEQRHLPVGPGLEAAIQHVLSPGTLDLVRIDFDEPSAADTFVPPVWFGADVTSDGAYDPSTMATQGIPAPSTVPLSDQAVNTLLDLLEDRPDRSSPTLPDAGPHPDRQNPPQRVLPSPAGATAPVRAHDAGPSVAPVPQPQTPDDDLSTDDFLAELRRTLTEEPKDPLPATRRTALP